MSPNTSFCRAATCSLAIAIALALGGCSHGDTATQTTPAIVHQGQRIEIPANSPLRERIKVAAVEMREAPHALEFPATIEADPAHMANVLPALGGRVAQLDVELGQHVTKGQVLAVLDSGDLAQAYSDLTKARDAMNLARKTLDRATAVEQAGGAAVKDLEAAHSGYAQAQSEYQRALTRLKALGGTPGDTAAQPMQVRAPISGTITALSIAPGMYVNDPTASMMTIANIDKVWVAAQVPANQLGLVKQGQTATASVPAYPGRVFRGTVSSVDAVLDADTGRDKLRIAVANADHALKPNMYARASVDVAQPAQVFVPQSALLMNNDSTTVFVEVAPWTFERRTVELSYGEGEDARVVKGLKAGERVIVAGGVLLND